MLNGLTSNMVDFARMVLSIDNSPPYSSKIKVPKDKKGGRGCGTPLKKEL